MLAEKFKAVSVLDPYLDTERLTFEEVMRYTTTRDFAIIDGKWVPGKKPTVFHLREVPHGLWEEFVLAGGEHERAKRAFMAGVYHVENLYGRDGVALDSWEPSRKRGDNLMMTDEESQRFSPAEREEIGAVVYTHSFLAPRIERHFQLSPSLLEHLGRRLVLRADQSPSTAGATINETHSVSTEPLQDPTVLASAESGG